MRYYAIIILLFAVLLGCRSSKHSAVSLDDQSLTESRGSVTRTDSTSHNEYTTDSRTSIDWERQYLRITHLDSLGRISYIQESWWESGSGQLDGSSRGSGDVSVKSEKKDSTRSEKKNIQFTKASSSQTDNRLLQGTDWLYLAVGVILALIILFNYMKYRKK